MKITMKNVVVFVRDLAIAKKFYIEQLRLPLVQETQMMMEFFRETGQRSAWLWQCMKLPCPLSAGIPG